MDRVYLDHAATTPVEPGVVREMERFFLRDFGNASSIYSTGREAALALDKARRVVARAINADEGEIIFTSGGTESDNLALVGVAMANKPKNHIITTKIEHHAILRTCEWLEKNGFRVTYLDVDKQGLVNPRGVEKAITSKTCLVSVMMVNNEIGTIQPIEEIGRMCREKGVYFHTDAVQGYGKIPIDVKKMNVDLLSASGHKIYGPKGVGMLYVRKGVRIAPMIYGGNQEEGIRAGTENLPGIMGFAKASEISLKGMKEEALQLAGLRDYMIRRVLEIPDSHLNGHPKKRLPGNAHFRFDYIEGEALILKLDAHGIEGSTGSACSSRELKPSHVLMALGLKPHQTHGSLRLTLGRHTTKRDIDKTIKAIRKVVGELREISPYREGWEDIEKDKGGKGCTARK
jgi:cysteine desulfurase